MASTNLRKRPSASKSKPGSAKPKAASKKTAKKSTGKAATKSARKATRSAVKKPGKSAGKRMGKQASKKSAKKTAKKTSSKAASRPAKAPAKRTIRKAAGAAVSSGRRVAVRPLRSRQTTQSLKEHMGAPAQPVNNASDSLFGGGPNGSNLGELIRETEARNTSLKTQAADSRGKRAENHFSESGSQRMVGHASVAGRKAQGRRDAAQRGDKRPGSAE